MSEPKVLSFEVIVAVAPDGIATATAEFWDILYNRQTVSVTLSAEGRNRLSLRTEAIRRLAEPVVEAWACL